MPACAALSGEHRAVGPLPPCVPAWPDRVGATGDLGPAIRCPRTVLHPRVGAQAGGMTTPTASTWWVEMFLGEVDGVSTARARLHSRDRSGLSGRGSARVSPRDRDVTEIGYELAAARALSDLAHQLLVSAADDISGVTRQQ